MGLSSNGKTTVFEAVNVGSTPAGLATLQLLIFMI